MFVGYFGRFGKVTGRIFFGAFLGCVWDFLGRCLEPLGDFWKVLGKFVKGKQLANNLQTQ